jgi:hypothetical protein
MWKFVLMSGGFGVSALVKLRHSVADSPDIIGKLTNDMNYISELIAQQETVIAVDLRFKNVSLSDLKIFAIK